MQLGVDGPEHADERDCDDRTEQAGGVGPQGDTDDDHHRVQRDLATHDEGLEDVPLDLADPGHSHADNDHGDEAAGGQGHHHGHEHCQRCADDRDEGANEHEHRQGSRQRDPHQLEEDPGHDGVGERYQHSAAGVPGEGVPAGASSPVGRLPHRGRQLVEEPAPHPAPGGQEEDRDEQCQGQDREHINDRTGVGQQLRGQGRGIGLQIVLPLAQPELKLVIDLLLRQVQRPVLQEVHDGIEAIAELGCQGAPLAGDRGDDVCDQSGDRTDGGEQCQEGRRVAGHDPGEEVDHRLEDRGEHQCHE